MSRISESLNSFTLVSSALSAVHVVQMLEEVVRVEKRLANYSHVVLLSNSGCASVVSLRKTKNDVGRFVTIEFFLLTERIMFDSGRAEVFQHKQKDDQRTAHSAKFVWANGSDRCPCKNNVRPRAATRRHASLSVFLSRINQSGPVSLLLVASFQVGYKGTLRIKDVNGGNVCKWSC
jgi:hypothetical protein